MHYVLALWHIFTCGLEEPGDRTTNQSYHYLFVAFLHMDFLLGVFCMSWMGDRPISSITLTTIKVFLLPLRRGGVCCPNKCRMWETKKNALIWRCCELYIHSRNRYFWSQHTSMLGVTLSNFYPIVWVHTSWLSYCCVCFCVTASGSLCGPVSCKWALFKLSTWEETMCCACTHVRVCWACAGLLGCESIKATGSQLAGGLICSSVAVNYPQC